MSEQDFDGFEADLQKLKPASPPEVFMDRLVATAEHAVRPRLVESDVRPTRPGLWESCWPVLRWLLPSAAAAGVVLLLASRPARPPQKPAVSSGTNPPLTADDVQLDRKFVGTFDAVAELPGGEKVRFRCQEWTDQMTLRNSEHGLEVVQSTPAFDVVPVAFETY